jgi:hypothetical protein
VRFLFRVLFFAAAFVVGGRFLLERLERGNASLVGAATPAPPSRPVPNAPAQPKGAPAAASSNSSTAHTDPAYDSLSKEELYRRAQAAGLKGRSKMSKEELAEAVAWAEMGGG